MALGATTASDFESEQVQGRKVSKVVKTTVVRGERMEKQMGDSTLAADLPSAKEDFEKVSCQGGRVVTMPGVSFLPQWLEQSRLILAILCLEYKAECFLTVTCFLEACLFLILSVKNLIECQFEDQL